MPLLDAPLNAANQHAANADEYLAQGLLIPASEEHQKAAEAYTAAVERCTDEHTKRTLRMLYEDHLKAGKELQRKITKLREENIDPTLPQKPTPPPRSSFPTSNAATHTSHVNPHKYSPRAVPSPPPSSRRMTDSQGTGDESFMVLGQRSDPGDAFNHFWNIMERLLENLSQPVAFATAPLPATTEYPPSSSLQRNGSLSSDTDIDEPIMKRLTAKKNGKDNHSDGRNSGTGQSPLSPTDLDEEEFEEGFFDEADNELSESFFLVPPTKTSSLLPPPSSTVSALQMENAALKADMELMQKRIAATERMLQLRKEQDQQLKESIYMARREAQRAMGTSAMLQIPRIAPGQATAAATSTVNIGPNVNVNSGPWRERETQLVRRVRELEEEMRVLKADNEKQKALVGKFREKWDKLKESAKRKKDAKAALSPGVDSGPSSSAGAREPAITEEPEEEQAQELEDRNRLLKS